MSFFWLLGVAAFVFVVGYIARVVYECFLYKCDLNQFQTAKRDGWALVTGCTGGIGEGFAYELASSGFHVLLVGRSESKLRALQDALQAHAPKVQTRIAVSDANSAAQVHIDSVVTAVGQLPAGSLKILVNNVGVSTEDPAPFADCTAQECEDMLAVNARYSTLLTHALLPALRQSKRTAIVNLSSLSAFFHVPYLAVYSATKAYNLVFSHALRDELTEEGIEVLALTPGFVASNMTRMRASFTVPTPRTCARAGLNAIGLRDHAGYWYHHVSAKATLLMPAAIRGKLTLSVMKNVRAAKAKKAAKLAAATLAGDEAGAGKKAQ